jgi:hypothetical protein
MKHAGLSSFSKITGKAFHILLHIIVVCRVRNVPWCLLVMNLISILVVQLIYYWAIALVVLRHIHSLSSSLIEGVEVFELLIPVLIIGIISDVARAIDI